MRSVRARYYLRSLAYDFDYAGFDRLLKIFGYLLRACSCRKEKREYDEYYYFFHSLRSFAQIERFYVKDGALVDIRPFFSMRSYRRDAEHEEHS